jgi:hypothetical protein
VIIHRAAARACGSENLARFAVEAAAAVFAESPSGLYCGRAGRAGFQLARLAAALKQSLAAPLAVAQPFREIYIASFTIHHKPEVGDQDSGIRDW